MKQKDKTYKRHTIKGKVLILTKTTKKGSVLETANIILFTVAKSSN